jgi:hypothetical protein
MVTTIAIRRASGDFAFGAAAAVGILPIPIFAIEF